MILRVIIGSDRKCRSVRSVINFRTAASTNFTIGGPVRRDQPYELTPTLTEGL
jgi:hypothetical protein